jgi:hypothetical protein
VTIDGTAPVGAPHTVVAGVVESPFLWFRPYGPPAGDEDAIRVAVASMRPGEIVPRLWSIYRGLCVHPGLHTGCATITVIRGEEGFVMDGELFSFREKFELQLTLGPRIRILEVLSPADVGIACAKR